jgi:serine-type D-Ala-D-Ala carboxypeptidase/endopeptidase (penicillin-binding protein 4)
MLPVRSVLALAGALVVALPLTAGAEPPDTGSALPPLAADAAVPDASAVSRVLAAPLSLPALGGGLVGEVVDAGTGRQLWQRGSLVPVMPASVVKLAVAVAALSVLGPTDRPRTQVLTTGTLHDGTLTGDLVLRGGGDPLLSSGTAAGWPARARLDDLASAVARAGIRVVAGRIVADGTLFAGPTLAPGWRATYVSDGSVAPVTALSVDGGRLRPGHDDSRTGDPALAAGFALRAVLADHRVRVVGPVVEGPGPAAARAVANVFGTPVAAAVDEMLETSDNDMAEALGRRVSLRLGGTASFAGAAQAVASTLARLGIPTAGLSLTDASGLSRFDLVTPATLVALLRYAADGPAVVRTVVASLPVEAFDGTLSTRDRSGAQSAGAGVVRAKTGNLEGVTSLAGEVVDADGRLLLFAFVTDATLTRGGAESALDQAAAALVAL